MMLVTFKTSSANWITERQFISVWVTILAMFRWTKTSPGWSPTIVFAATRLSEQPIQRYSGDCCLASSTKKSGSRSFTASDHRRLLAKSTSIATVQVFYRLRLAVQNGICGRLVGRRFYHLIGRFEKIGFIDRLCIYDVGPLGHSSL